MGNSSQNRRDFLKGSLKGSLGLLVVSTFGGTTLYGRIFPKSYKRLPGNMIAATYTLKVSDYPTVEIPNAELGPIRLGLTEIGSSIKLRSEIKEEDDLLLQMNPDHCRRSGTDGKKYPISVVRVKEDGEDAFVAVSSWCPHNNKSQLSSFAHTLGDSGMFVCTEHEDSCFTANGTWIPPEESPYPDAPPKDEFFFNVNPDDGTPYLTSFRTTFDGVDTITVHDVLQECLPLSAPDHEVDGYSLEANYPNPVRHSTIFRFNLPGPTQALLAIVTSDGKEVAVVLDRRMEAGVHSVDFKAKGLPTGSYFYKLETEFGTKTRKMTVVK